MPIDVINYIVEVSFFLDIVLNFLTEYKDPETYESIRSHSKIAKKYVFRGWFIIDFVAIIPFQYIIGSSGSSKRSPFQIQTKLIRLFRLPRLIKLIDISRFNQLLKSLFENNSQEERLMMQYLVMYAYKIFRLFIIAFIITYFSGCVWYLVIEEFKNEAESSFYFKNKMGDKDNFSRLIISCYFALSTLSTVGYGDYYPITDVEIITAVSLMLCGVAFFSYIMGSFIDIISNYQKKMGIVDKSTYLRNWMTLLTRFTGNKPLSKSLKNQIESHFAYFW